MKPEDLEALADRIDPDQLWRQNGTARGTLTQEQRDQLDAGVNLRRYAHQRLLVVEELKNGAEYIHGYKLERHFGGTNGRGCGTGAWHGAINTFSDQQREAGKPFPSMMYLAKTMSDEVPRMVLLFERERAGQLPANFKLCGHDLRPATALPDNHLRCHLGQQCRKCEFLQAIESSKRMTPEAKDEAKAWTCATHIMRAAPAGDYIEQFLYEKSDDAFRDRMLESFGVEQ